MWTPCSLRSLAATENLTSLAAIYVAPLMSWIAVGRALRGLLAGDGLFENAHDVAFLHDQEIDAVDLDLGARPLAEQHALADLEIDRNQFAGLVAAARTDSHDLALRGLLFGGVGNDDAARGLLLGIDALDDDAVVKRAEFHGYPPKCLLNRRFFEAGGRARRAPSGRSQPT